MLARGGRPPVGAAAKTPKPFRHFPLRQASRGRGGCHGTADRATLCRYVVPISAAGLETISTAERFADGQAATSRATVGTSSRGPPGGPLSATGPGRHAVRCGTRFRTRGQRSRQARVQSRTWSCTGATVGTSSRGLAASPRSANCPSPRRRVRAERCRNCFANVAAAAYGSQPCRQQNRRELFPLVTWPTVSAVNVGTSSGGLTVSPPEANGLRLTIPRRGRQALPK